MKWNKIKEILDENFSPDSSIAEDVIGELVKVPEDIKNIIVSLDVTLDVISQAKLNNANLIIAHHPYYWGESKEKSFMANPFLKSMEELLKNEKIGVYIIHTNADFASNSIAYMQGLALDLENLEQNSENKSVSGNLATEISIKEFSDLIKKTLELEFIDFRTNLDSDVLIKKIKISSGASGSYGIDLNDTETLHILGEVKYHEWVRANERGVKILEISHFSEKIFKEVVAIFLENENIKLIKAVENNGYKSI